MHDAERRTFLATLVRPSKWQFLAWAQGGSTGVKMDKWHTIEGLVHLEDLGVEVIS